MFGYVTIYKDELKIKDYNKYQSYYCGVCHSLGSNYGLSGRMTLSYDMTFLAVLLSALYEDNTEAIDRRCIPHPIKTHKSISNEFTDYAAAINVMLTYYKMKDNWEDEHSLKSNAFAGMLKRAYKKASARHPDKAGLIENYIREQKEVENSQTSVDLAANPTGRMLSGVFCYKNDMWHDSLSRMGFFLGKFIYIMDAFEDIDKDIKKNNYNPLIPISNENDFVNRIKDMLTMLAAESARGFEALPILDNSDILRNIIYAGMWSRFDAIINKTADKENIAK